MDIEAREQALVDAGKVIRLNEYKQRMAGEEFDEYLEQLCNDLEYYW